MNDAQTELQPSTLSMRRTLLTLLGAVGAFAVLTASYATAELPSPSSPMDAAGIVATVR